MPDTQNSEDKRSFDIAKPGKVAADPTSRPLIGVNPIVQDPMVRSGETSKNTSEQSDKNTGGSVLIPKNNKTIAPLSTAEKLEMGETSIAPEADHDESEDTTAESVSVSGLDEQINKKNTEQEDAAKMQAQQEEIEKLVAAKKYFVPIGNAQKSRRTMFVALVIGIAFIAVGVGVYMLINASA